MRYIEPSRDKVGNDSAWLELMFWSHLKVSFTSKFEYMVWISENITTALHWDFPSWMADRKKSKAGILHGQIECLGLPTRGKLELRERMWCEPKVLGWRQHLPMNEQYWSILIAIRTHERKPLPSERGITFNRTPPFNLFISFVFKSFFDTSRGTMFWSTIYSYRNLNLYLPNPFIIAS